MDVSVIIVNYNTSELTQKCIASIYAFTKENSFEIILVDNNSSDDSVEVICKRFPEVKLILNTENIGFGRGNNRGNAIAKGEYVFFLNSDAYLISDAIKSFFDFMNEVEHAKVAVVGGELLSGQDFDTVSYGNLPSVFEYFSYLGFKKFYKNYFEKKLASGIVNKNSDIKEVGYVNGADMFFRKEIFDLVGQFDEDFFLYFEETELSHRLIERGFVSMIIPAVKIIHLVSFYRDTFSDFNYNKLKIYSKSRFLYFKKTSGLTAAFLTNIMTSILYILQGLMRKDKDNFIKKAWICLTTYT
jgi:hypothetical protein